MIRTRHSFFTFERKSRSCKHISKEGRVSGIWSCRREPTLKELLEDDVMRLAMRSAGLDADAFKLQLREAAHRIRTIAEPRG
jgi:hypothetical protein